MTRPRPNTIVTPTILARRKKYDTYIKSKNWREKRKTWYNNQTRPPECLICGKPWKLKKDDLHHLTYQRLTHENLEDLAPLCRECHDLLHQILDITPARYATKIYQLNMIKTLHDYKTHPEKHGTGRD